nr:MAG TPA: hypothetical protein [Caudoviricetes sp.]
MKYSILGNRFLIKTVILMEFFKHQYGVWIIFLP